MILEVSAASTCQRAPVIENDFGKLIEERVAAGRPRTTTEAAAAMRSSGLFLICVGIPSLPNGRIELKYLRRV